VCSEKIDTETPNTKDPQTAMAVLATTTQIVEAL
jgi:hypothetical protein